MTECIVCYEVITFETKLTLPCSHSNTCKHCWERYEKECIDDIEVPKCFYCRNKTLLNFSWYNIIKYLYCYSDFVITEYYDL